MKARIAMFQRGADRAWQTVFARIPDAIDGDDWTIEPYVRISEWMDVEFIELPAESTVPAQLAMLERKAEEVKAEFAAKLREIADARASLLALTHEVAK